MYWARWYSISKSLPVPRHSALAVPLAGRQAQAEAHEPAEQSSRSRCFMNVVMVLFSWFVDGLQDTTGSCRHSG